MAALHLTSLAQVPATRESRSGDHSGSTEDSLLSFNPESSEEQITGDPIPVAPAVHRSPPARWTTALSGRWVAATTAAVLVVLALALLQARRTPERASPSGSATTGIIDITSQPPGAGIMIDREPRGMTPLRLSLGVGPHVVAVSSGGVERSLPVTIGADTVLSQHIEFASGRAGNVGRLEVTTDSPGAQVVVDGKPRGTTPLIIGEIAEGEHTVTVSRDGIGSDRKVAITAGATAIVLANVPAAGTASGWVRIKAPFEFQVFEGGRLIGTTATERLMLPPGRHDLNVRNAPFAFNTAVHVVVASGKTVVAALEIPTGTLSINAFPWAEIAIDGRAAGLTPLGNVSLPIGPHEVVWRHPQLGERRQTVSVTATSPVGVGMDLTK